MMGEPVRCWFEPMGMTMPLYPLIIDNQARALISVARELAHKNPIDHATLRALVESGSTEPLPINRSLTVEIPACYTATFTIEEQVPGHMFRHLSVAIINGRPETCPHPAVIDDIMREYGFVNARENVQGRLERLPGGNNAVNVLEPLDGDWTPFLAS